jgi:hypothetical protein
VERRPATIALAAILALVLMAVGPPELDDGALSRERPEERWMRILDQFDRDGNGRLDERERAAMLYLSPRNGSERGSLTTGVGR